MRICVIGSGYVGLVTAAVFSDLGNEVECVDIDGAKVEKLNAGKMPIYEPGLEEIVARNVKQNRLSFSTEVDAAVTRSEIIFICVGTPAMENGQTDLSYVTAAAKTIAGSLNGYKIVVNKSTVPVGTGDLVRRVITEAHGNSGRDFDVVSNPEFLREGQAIADALKPDRIIVGAPSKKVAMKLLELYATLGAPIIITDVQSAELIKYASNAFLAMKISFINQVADICEEAGANIIDVSKALGLDKRIGGMFLNAGLGYGGSCFPKDVLSLIHSSGELGIDFGLLKEVVNVNNNRIDRFVGKIHNRFPEMKDRVIGILGLAFKPETDDMRDAKSIAIINSLVSVGAKIKAYDPVAMDSARSILPDITYCQSPYETAEGADAIVIVTEWRAFQQLDLEKIRGLMKTPVIFDGRNMYNPERKRSFGFEYYSVGRP